MRGNNLNIEGSAPAFVSLALLAGTVVSVWQATRAVTAERQTAIALAEARLQNQLARRAVDDLMAYLRPPQAAPGARDERAPAG